MFKWSCLGVATVFLVAVLWILNDIRLQVRESGTRIRTAGGSLEENLPAIVEKTRQTTETLSQNLPQVIARVDKMTLTLSDNLPDLVDRAGKASEVIAELAEDIRQLKELAGISASARDKSLVAYANGLLGAVESSGGTIGVKKTVGKGLKNTRPAAEWVVGARREALVLTILVKSKKEMLTRLGKTKLGANWMIELPDKEPMTLIDWLRQNHSESKEVG